MRARVRAAAVRAWLRAACVAAVAGVAGCGTPVRPASTPVDRDVPIADGAVQARWSGKQSGRMTGPGTAEWCQQGGYLLLRGTQGDTGIGILFYPTESVRAGTLLVSTPRGVDSVTRPSAAIALRWFGASAVLGYRARTGSVIIDRSSGGLSGRFKVSAIATTQPDTISLTGRFRGIAIRPGRADCVASDATAGATTGTDTTGD